MNVNAKLLALVFPALALLFLATACGGGDGEERKFPETVVLGADDVQPQLVSTELVTGPNRFAFVLIDPQGELIIDADVHLAFYYLEGGVEEKRFEVDALSTVPARDAGIEEVIEHTHADGSVHQHFNVGQQIGLYSAIVEFPEPGRWGVEIEYDAGEEQGTILPSFTVGTQSTTVPIGADAPRSSNRTVDDVDDLSLIDSSTDPTEDMHRKTIAEAIETGRPVLLLFATPGYCTSQICGPEYEIMRKLYDQYSDRVEFVHVEPFDVPASPEKKIVPAMEDYGLTTEPWFFVIDSQGKVSMKFEGPTSMQELVNALENVLT